MTDVKQFGDLSREEKLKLFEAWLDGETIQSQDAYGNWVNMVQPRWYDEDIYRIVPRKPSIDWDHVVPEYKWLAVDKDGSAFFYKERPECGAKKWMVNGFGFVTTRGFASFDRGTCDWQDSLICRPGMEGEE